VGALTWSGYEAESCTDHAGDLADWRLVNRAQGAATPHVRTI